MAAESRPSEEAREEIGPLAAGSFIVGVSFISLFSGFALALGRVRKKSPAEFSEVNASRLALKALGLGTLFSVSGCGLIFLGIKWALQVKSAEEFGNVMKSRFPQKDGAFVKRFESWKIPRKETDDQNEWDKAFS